MVGCYSEDIEFVLQGEVYREIGILEKGFLNFYILYGDSFQYFNSSFDGWEMVEEILGQNGNGGFSFLQMWRVWDNIKLMFNLLELKVQQRKEEGFFILEGLCRVVFFGEIRIIIELFQVY